MLLNCSRLFAFDTMGEHGWIPDRLDQFDKAVIYLMESHCYDSFMASIVPEEDDVEKEFNLICSEVYDAGNMLFLAEEIPMLGCSPQQIPKKFNKIVRLGRHRNIDLLYTAQRIGDCPVVLRSQTDLFILFCHTEPRDLEAIEDRCGSEIARKVTTLGEHGFLIYDTVQRKEISTGDCESIIATVSPNFQEVTLDGGRSDVR